VPAGAARSPESVWIVNDAFRVDLGTHVFGQVETPEAVVARAGPTEVGFNYCPDAPGSCGQPTGPWSFEIAEDGSIWLLDQLNSRLLVWEPGHPDAVARTVPLPVSSPQFAFGDFALGPAGSVYLVRSYSKGPPLHAGLFPPQGHLPPVRLSRVSEDGKVLWTSKVDTDIANTQLRTGPDGTLWVGAWSATWKDDPYEWRAWAPAATSAGRPVSLARQEAGIRWTASVPDGRQIVLVSAGWTGLPWTPEPHEQRVALIDTAGRVVRAWRIRSGTSIEPPFPSVTPALVGGDPVVVLFPTRPQGGEYQREYLVLRLGRTGDVRTRFALPYDEPPVSAYEGWAVTGVRIQPDGRLYQLGSAPDFGAAVYQYSLAPTG
jgi:hypothetical protein